MKKFRIGDKVVLDTKFYPTLKQFFREKDILYGIIARVESGERYHINWEKGSGDTYHSIYIKPYIDCYIDFEERIKERLE